MEAAKSKTKQALDLVDSGMTAYAAAEQVGITEQAVYAAKRRREKAKAAGKVPCPCCGTMVDAARLDRSVPK